MKTKEQTETEKVFENPETLREKFLQTEDFFVRYRQIILGVIVAVLVAAGGAVYYFVDKKQQNEEAQREMYGAVLYFESDSLTKALEGDLKNKGLLTISEDYSDTKAGKLADFYIGAIYLKQGKFQDATSYLQQAGFDDLLLEARRLSLMGDAYLEQEQLDKALEFYKKATEYKPNPQFTPQYIMKAALACELKKDYQQAVDLYDRIIDTYPTSQQLNTAKKYKSRDLGFIHQK